MQKILPCLRPAWDDGDEHYPSETNLRLQDEGWNGINVPEAGAA